MKYMIMVLVVLSACAQDEPSGTPIGLVEMLVSDGAEPVSMDAAEPIEPEEDAPWRHHGPVVSVEEMGLGSHTTGSSRLIRQGATEVQRVPAFHSGQISRRSSEASVIRADVSIEDPDRVIDLTALVLARIAVSESGWDGERDMAGIYQVLRTTRRSTDTLMTSMRRSSRIASEIWEPRNRRERWLRGLNLEETRPAGFPMDQESWDRTYRPKWHAIIGRAHALLSGRDRTRPCPVTVIAWGGRCDVAAGACDDHIARRRGLVQVESCGDTRNRFWGRPRSFNAEQIQVEMTWRAIKGISVTDALSLDHMSDSGSS